MRKRKYVYTAIRESVSYVDPCYSGQFNPGDWNDIAYIWRPKRGIRIPLAKSDRDWIDRYLRDGK